MRHLFALLFVVLPQSVLAAADWQTLLREPVAEIAMSERFAYAWTAGTPTSEDLDVRSCTGGVSVAFDPSVLDASVDATATVYSCPTDGAALGSCTVLQSGSGVSIPGNTNRSFPTEMLQLGVGSNRYLDVPFLRVVGTVAPVASDQARVDVACTPRLTLRPLASTVPPYYDDLSLSFADLRDTSCNGVSCTPNDPLTPVWVRQAIGAAAADTFVPGAAWQLTGVGILDPGTAAATGVQYTMTPGRSLVLDATFRLGLPHKGMHFSAQFGRSATTNVFGVGLCAQVPSTGVSDLMLDAAGAFTAANVYMGVKWNTTGTFTARFSGSSGAVEATTAKTYTTAAYHTVTISQADRSILLSPSLDLNHLSTVNIYIDGVLELVSTITTMPLATNQLSPCVAMVNAGALVDTATITNIDWFVPRAENFIETN